MKQVGKGNEMKRFLKFFGILLILGITVSQFQNCTPIKFNSATNDSSSSLASAEVIVPASPSANGAGQKLRLKNCEDSGCLETGNQKLFFTDVVGRLLSAQIVAQTSDSLAQVRVVDERSIRSAIVQIRLLETGYAALNPDSTEKPWLCVDSTAADNAGDIIDSKLNCLSAVLMTGTNQRSQKTSDLNFKSTVASLNFMVSRTTVFKTMNLSSFGTSTELFSNFFIGGFAGFGAKQFVVYDALGMSEGLTISSYQPLVIGIGNPAGLGINLVLRDSEGRMASLDIKTKNADGVAIPLDVTNNVFLGHRIGFTGPVIPSSHPYLCFDHSMEPLSIIRVPVANGQLREALNCFASPRYSILENYGPTPTSSGFVPVHNNKLTFRQMNMSYLAADDQQYLAKPIFSGP